MGQTEESASLYDAGLEKGALPNEEWKPSRTEYGVMITLAVISLMVALDATILVSVLPVSDCSFIENSTGLQLIISRHWPLTYKAPQRMHSGPARHTS
jgi:hypothetical protein